MESRAHLVGAQFADPAGTDFHLDVLKKTPAGGLPKEIDPAHKELYLSDEKFQEVFKMSPADFEKLKPFKKKDLKKKVGLF